MLSWVWIGYISIELSYLVSGRPVSLETPSGEEIIFQGSAPPHSLFVLARLFPGQRAVKTGMLWSLIDKPSKALSIEEIPVVRDYPDVFPSELPGMPPERAVEF